MSGERIGYGLDIAPDGTETLAEATLGEDGIIRLNIVRLGAESPKEQPDPETRFDRHGQEWES